MTKRLNTTSIPKPKRIVLRVLGFDSSLAASWLFEGRIVWIHSSGPE
jgi:hypothetical protein